MNYIQLAFRLLQLLSMGLRSSDALLEVADLFNVWVPLQSSCLAAVYYDDKGNTLLVKFTDGRSGSYNNVSEETFAELLTANSKGSFFNARIRDD